MKSYVYPKLLRETVAQRYLDDPDARSEAVNRFLHVTPVATLQSLGLRRARQTPKVEYEPFAVTLDAEAMAALDALPKSASKSAIMQHILVMER